MRWWQGVWRSIFEAEKNAMTSIEMRWADLSLKPPTRQAYSDSSHQKLLLLEHARNRPTNARRSLRLRLQFWESFVTGMLGGVKAVSQLPREHIMIASRISSAEQPLVNKWEAPAFNAISAVMLPADCAVRRITRMPGNLDVMIRLLRSRRGRA